ncbi:MAG: sensor histidine kinase, partial [Chloroflexi bacterium]|nr:sensor histidine kinase [Chloroflexota bacterium]
MVEQQRTLAALDERDRVSRDLHDGLAQVMSSISLQTQAAQTLLAQGHDEAANSSLASVLQLSRDANADIRNFILGLRTPQTSASPDLFSTLVDFLREYGEQSDIQASLSIPSDYSFPALAPAAEEQVLRIIQESLANTRKHAQAHKVEILFSADERSLQVAIMDDGVGFDMRQRQSDDLPHFGMNMMRDRVKILGGRLDVRSAPGQGTKILVFIPREIADAAPVATKNLLDLRLLLVDDSP